MKLKPKKPLRSAAIAFSAGSLMLVLTLVLGTTTSQVAITPSHASVETKTLGYDDLKPIECTYAEVVNFASGGVDNGGTIELTGTSAADLLLADNTTEVIFGTDDDDCIVGGTATTQINGGAGADDVCISATLSDPLDFPGCEHINP